MDDASLVTTRRALHGVAELVIAGPQFRAAGSIELRVRSGGIQGAVSDVAVIGDELVGPGGRARLGGTCRTLASAVGSDVSDLADVYRQGSGVDPDEELSFDPAAVELLLSWFGRGAAALRALLPDETPILWPEHFDVGVTADHVNYGASPGDEDHPRPYAYVGPWDPERVAALRADDPDFWNTTFGASRAADSVDDEALLGFLVEGRRRAAG